MSIRWCAYCQQFLGESPPFDRHDFTYGICPNCRPKSSELTADEFANMQRLADFQARLWETGEQADLVKADVLIEDAAALGIRPADLAIGLMAPLLHRVGERWTCGEMSVADEHRFTAFCEGVLERISLEIRRGGQVTRSPDAKRILLVNANGNQHTLGVRVLKLWLESKGNEVDALYPGLPPSEVAALVHGLKPHVLGISVSMEEQLAAVKESIDAVRAIEHPNMPRILVGGSAVKLIPGIRVPNARVIADPAGIFD